MMTPDLATLGRGFGAPAQAAQLSFRCLLEAMARPGRVQSLPATALAGVEAPAIGVGMCAVLLTLLDADTRLYVDEALPHRELLPYLRFHTGVRLTDDLHDADFVCCSADQARPPLLNALRHGSDEAPHHGATLLIAVSELGNPLPSTPGGLQLRGPGIRDCQYMSVGGIGAEFWRTRSALEAQFPRGVDLVMCCGDHIAAIPRSTHVSSIGLED
ncbi:MAG: phosphonate C-P lyase system protein PhnH [Variovorax sp.]